MVYLWAVVRTIVILLGVVIALFVAALIATWLWFAFNYSFGIGCITLTGIAGVLSLFGHQLAIVAKLPRAKWIGARIRFGCGTVAGLCLVLASLTYGYTTVQQLRGTALPAGFVLVTDPAEIVAYKAAQGTNAAPSPAPKVVTDPALIAKYNATPDDPLPLGTREPQRPESIPTDGREPQKPEPIPTGGRGPSSPPSDVKFGSFADLFPKPPATANSLPTCDEALIAAHKAVRGAPTANVFDRFDPVQPARPCLRPVTDPKILAQLNGSGSVPAPRVILFEGWEIRAPATTTDETIVRVLDELRKAPPELPTKKSP